MKLNYTRWHSTITQICGLDKKLKNDSGVSKQAFIAIADRLATALLDPTIFRQHNLRALYTNAMGRLFKRLPEIYKNIYSAEDEAALIAPFARYVLFFLCRLDAIFFFNNTFPL